MTVFLGLLTASVLLWALRWPMPDCVRDYLRAQLLYIPPVWIAYLLWGDRSWAYSCIYSGFTALILVRVGQIGYECLKNRAYRLRGMAIVLLIAMATARRVYVGIGPLDWNEWIVLVEGMALLTAGSLLCAVAVLTLERDVLSILALLWLAQGFFDMGYLIEDWYKVNWIVPPLTGITAFALLGCRFRAEWRKNLKLPEKVS